MITSVNFKIFYVYVYFLYTLKIFKYLVVSRSAFMLFDVADRFSTMPKSFGGTRPLKKDVEDYTPENIITSQTFEPSQNPILPSGVPWRTSVRQTTAATVTQMPPKPPTRQRMAKFSTFDTRSMIDLSRKRSQSQIVSIYYLCLILIP